MSQIRNWHEIFLKRMIIIGCLLVFLIPPIQAADENVHFFNAYAFMKGDFFPEYENGTYIGRTFPRDIINYVEIWNADEDRRASVEDALYAPGPLDINEKDTAFLPYWASDTNMVGYIFSGFGMLVCSLLYKILHCSMSGYDLLVAGRLFNLLFYTLTTYYAIKITPHYKKTLLALALMPMVIFQASTLSYDAVLIPCCFLLFAITLRGICKKEEITTGMFITMCLISIVLFCIKTVYAPLLLGLAFIPKERFGGMKKYLIAGFTIVGCGIGVLGISKILFSVYTYGYQNPYEPMQAAQVQHLLENAISFIGYILNSFKQYSGFYFTSFFGVIGKLDLTLPFFILIYYAIFLVFISIEESSCGNIIKYTHRILMGLMLALIVYISFAGIYVTWTAIQQGVGGNWVDGVQGRYFIPIAIYIPLLFAHKKMWKKKILNAEILNEITYYTVTVIPLLTVMFELLRFWNI